MTRDDLAERGTERPDSGDPFHDPEFVSVVTAGYGGYVR